MTREEAEAVARVIGQADRGCKVVASPSMHPTTRALLQWFDCDHLAPRLRDVVEPFRQIAHDLAVRGSGPEVTVALRKLLESKDAAVRAMIVAFREDDTTPIGLTRPRSD